MPITLVATVPKSIPSSANAAPTDADTQSAELDFSNMLFGQLARGANDAPGKELLLWEAGGPETEGSAATGDDDEANDALALLAALGAPTSFQADALPSAGLAPADIVKGAADSGLASTDIAQGAAHAGLASTDIAQGAAHAPALNTDAAPTAKAALSVQQNDSSQPDSFVSFDESMSAAAADPASKKPATFAVPDSLSTGAGPSSTAQSADSAASPPTTPHSVIATVASSHTVNRSEPDTSAIPSPLRDPHWNNDFAQKIVWLASNQKQAAELTLNPPNMGSIEVSLRIDNDQATATFVSSNADVRESIESALPRLREMLAGVGISLGQANVSAESFRQASGQGQENPGASPGTSDNAILAGVPRDMTDSVRQLTASGRGLVDLFA